MAENKLISHPETILFLGTAMLRLQRHQIKS